MTDDNIITDAESLSESPRSIETDHDVRSPTVTIVHHNGTEVVQDFDRIEEIGIDTIRVFWSDETDFGEYTDFHVARITDVKV